MNEMKAFLDALARDPYDWDTRRIYGDWLEDQGMDDEALEQRTWTPEKQEAVDWIKTFSEACQMSYGSIIKSAHEYLD